MKGKKNNRRPASRQGKTNSRRPMNERDYREEREGRDVRDSRGAMNDVSWYTRYPNLSVASAQFPFPYRPGMKMQLDPNRGVPYIVPGVMEMQWYPSIGWSESATDPASIVCKELFQKVRKAYGAGDLLCDAPDFMVYLMALDGVFSYLASIRRIFRLLSAWTPDNYQLPDTVLEAMGCNQTAIQNLRINRNQLWQVLNELTLMSRKFTCPAVMDIMNRHFWMNDNVYTDAPTVNSQFYVFHQMGYYRYKPQNMPSGDPASGLEMVASPFVRTNNALTVTSVYEFGRALIDALVAWDDAYTINGYLSRAFEGTPNFIVDETPLDQPFNPVYEPEVLMQIENSRSIWAGTLDLTSLAVSQDILTNSIISKPTVTLFTATKDSAFRVGKHNLHYVPPTLSQRSDAPQVADNIVASRLQVNFEPLEGSTTQARVIAATEIPTAWYEHSVFGVGLEVSSVAAVEFNTELTPTYGDYAIFNMGAYDWHPIAWVFFYNVGQNRLYNISAAGDVHNVTVITADDLKNMHKICVYSEFNAFSIE